MMQRNEATERQVQAARPDMSTWLAANAGSGKTRVLTDRVARLLLEGVQPQHILCLTYTKAAASEMQNRLFERLGAWAMRPDAELRNDLTLLGIETDVTRDVLDQARTLFARAIETPGGLKIQTIHSFCSSLLRRFPLEAGVSPQFKELDEATAKAMQADVLEHMATGPDAPILMDFMRIFTGDIADAIADISKHRAYFEAKQSRNDFLSLLNLPEGFTQDTLLEQVFLGGEHDWITRLHAALKTGSANDVKAAEGLARLLDHDSYGIGDLEVLEKAFLFTSGKTPGAAKIGRFPTKDLAASIPEIMDKIEPLMKRVEEARANRLALRTADTSAVMTQFAHVFMQRYQEMKQHRGALDFDDLILKVRDLLNDPAVAQWVLFRLDGGIDHILVDEAQDTSPTQWDVIERLAQEFTSGEGARADVLRTIFVVGDKKQSIYSFQGADPSEFDRMREEFDARLQTTGTPLQSLELEYSFRSSDAVLGIVDTCFDALGMPMTHKAFKQDLPGRVDLWPHIEHSKQDASADFEDPVDRVSDTHHTVKLAHMIADEIKRMIDCKEPLPVDLSPGKPLKARPVEAGDFLILVQKRSALFHALIRACKERALPIAGADQLKVNAEIAVRDIRAYLSFLATPEDDLSLATILKSPLFGWDEQALYDLAHKRQQKYLWQALRDRAEEFPETLSVLRDMMARTDFLRPYDLIERILTRHDGRRKFIARLGHEAEDGLDALLAQALGYETQSIPSLTGFLAWLETDELKVKRQMDAAGNQIRVMTVHGSKGLESSIVILPETGDIRSAGDRGCVIADDEVAFFKGPAHALPERLVAIKDEQKRLQEEERDRLLYVALTRAEKWLIVAACGKLDEKNGNTWYQKVMTALEHRNAVPLKMPEGMGKRYEHGDWQAVAEVAARAHDDPTTSPPETRSPLPDHFRAHAAKPTPPPAPMSPSDLGGAKAIAGPGALDEETAMWRGTQIHRLLEHLPQIPKSDWEMRYQDYLDPEIDGQHHIDIYQEAQRVLNAPALAHLFGDDGLSEVALTAPLPALDGARMHGIIDRLVVKDDHVLVVDFKTNAIVPKTADQCPDGILRQMAAYYHAVSQIYPQKEVRCAVLWTKTATLMDLGSQLMNDTLERCAIP